MFQKLIKRSNADRTALTDAVVTENIRQHTSFNVPPFCLSDDPRLHLTHDGIVHAFPVNSFIVVNTARQRDKDGQHWTGLYQGPKFSYYFDSVGLNPRNTFFDISNWSRRVFDSCLRPIIHHENRYQDPDSNVCGEFLCIFAVALEAGIREATTHNLSSSSSLSSFIASRDLFSYVDEEHPLISSPHKLATDINDANVLLIYDSIFKRR